MPVCRGWNPEQSTVSIQPASRVLPVHYHVKKIVSLSLHSFAWRFSRMKASDVSFQRPSVERGFQPMSRLSTQRWAMPTTLPRPEATAPDYCCRASARASNRWRRASTLAGSRPPTRRCTTSSPRLIGPTPRGIVPRPTFGCPNTRAMGASPQLKSRRRNFGETRPCELASVGPTCSVPFLLNVPGRCGRHNDGTSGVRVVAWVVPPFQKLVRKTQFSGQTLQIN